MAVEVSYQTRRSDAWRCNLFLLFGNGKLLTLWLIMLLAGRLIVPTLFGISAFIVFLSSVPVIGMLWMSIGGQFPERDSTRACTTRLDAEGIQDVTPDGTKFIPWASVASIRLIRGDAYFLTRAQRGFFVPRSANTSQFVEEARRLQKLADRVPATRLAFETGGVQSVAPVKSAAVALTASQQRGCSWLIAVPVFLLMVIGTGWGAASLWTDSRRAADFHRSPGCFPAAPLSSPLPPCTEQTLTVARAWVIYHSKSPDDYDLALQGSGRAQTIEVRRALWDKLAVGTPLQVTLWRGKIVRASAFGLTSRTDDNPDYALRWDKSLLIVSLIGLTFFGVIFRAEMRKKLKKETI